MFADQAPLRELPLVVWVRRSKLAWISFLIRQSSQF